MTNHNFIRHKWSNRGFSFIELLVGLLILTMAIAAATVGIQAVSKLSAAHTMAARAEALIREAAESMRYRSGSDDFFLDDKFKMSYYFPGDTKEGEPKTPSFDQSRIKVEAVVGPMDVFSRTRQLTLSATYYVGSQVAYRHRQVTLTHSRLVGYGGRVRGKVIDALTLKPVPGILVHAPGDGAPRVYARSNEDGIFDLRGVKLGTATVTLQGDARGVKPSYYFRDIDDIDTDLSDGRQSVSGSKDAWDVDNSKVQLGFYVNVPLGQVDLGEFQMWPFGKVSGAAKAIVPESVSSSDADPGDGIKNVIVELLPLRREILTCGRAGEDPCLPEHYSYYDTPSEVLTNADGSFSFDDVVPGIYRIYMNGTGEPNPKYKIGDPPDFFRYIHRDDQNLFKVWPRTKPTAKIYAAVAAANDSRVSSWYINNKYKRPSEISGCTGCFEIKPGDIYDVPRNITNPAKYNEEGTTHFYTVEQGDHLITGNGTDWSGTDKKFISNSISATAYWGVYYLSGSPFDLREPLGGNNEVDWVGNSEAAGYFRWNYAYSYWDYAGLTDGQHKHYFAGPPVFSKSAYNGSLAQFDTPIGFLLTLRLYDGSNPKLAPFTIFEDPVTGMQFYGGDSGYGASIPGGEYYGWPMLIPSMRNFTQDGSIHSNWSCYSWIPTPAQDPQFQVEYRAVQHNFLLGRKGLDMKVNLLGRDALRRVTGEITDLSGNPFDPSPAKNNCTSTTIYTIGIVNSAGLMMPRWDVPIPAVWDGSKMTFDTGNTVLPSLMRAQGNPDPYVAQYDGTTAGHGYGNGRRLTFVCERVTPADKRLEGPIIAWEKMKNPAGDPPAVMNLVDLSLGGYPTPALATTKYCYGCINGGYIGVDIHPIPITITPSSFNPTDKTVTYLSGPLIWDVRKIIIARHELGMIESGPASPLSTTINVDADQTSQMLSLPFLRVAGDPSDPVWTDGTEYRMPVDDAWGDTYTFKSADDKFTPQNANEPYRNIIFYKNLYFKKVCARLVDEFGDPLAAGLPVRLWVSRDGRKMSAISSLVGTMTTDANGQVCFEDGAIIDDGKTSPRPMVSSDRMFAGFKGENILVMGSPNATCMNVGTKSEQFDGYEDVEVFAVIALERNRDCSTSGLGGGVSKL